LLGHDIKYASALIEIDKLKKELRTCRSVVDGFRVAAEVAEEKLVNVEGELAAYRASAESKLEDMTKELLVLSATSDIKDFDINRETLKVVKLFIYLSLSWDL
jgi:DnaJ-domain-containing protein 1